VACVDPQAARVESLRGTCLLRRFPPQLPRCLGAEVSTFVDLTADVPREKGAPAAAAPRAPLTTQVRCDAASLGVPCTNCTAFGIDCRIPSPKRKKTQAKAKDGGERCVSHLGPGLFSSPQ
jgi:Fungal Zn(2)-Cys(6) binuclear cluster domain